jgi:alpha-aminoadipate/glutamate carrier protein LysW
MTFPNKKNKVTNKKMIKQANQPEVKASIAKCPDCDANLEVPSDTEKGEILSCPGCGLELEVKQVKGGCVDLQELTIEGEDWGE